MSSLNEFRDSIKRVSESRNHKIKNSYGVYDAYKYNRKLKWINTKKSFSEHDYYSVIRRVGEYIAQALSCGDSIKLPNKMGTLGVYKKYSNPTIIDGKLVIKKPVDWEKTIAYWFECPEAREERQLIYSTNNEIFKLLYHSMKANYNNKHYYEFKFNRDIKQMLKNNIQNNSIDAMLQY